MRYLRSPLLILLIIVTLVIGQAKKAKTAPENETLPRNLVLRLLDYSPFSEESSTQLLVGQLPKQLPVELPLPDGAKVVASIMRQTDNFQIILDTPQSSEQVQAFYQQRLAAAGWQNINEPLFTQRGFSSSQANLSTPIAFCTDRAGGASLLIVTKTQQQLPTDVRINLNTNQRNSGCEANQRVALLQERLDKVPFPNLPAPPKTQVQPKGSGGSGREHWYSIATLVSQSDIQALITHYENQFKQAGWTKLDAKQSEAIAWSSWTIKDKEGKFWQGVLNLRKVEGKPNNYSASAIVF
jgi:hypothetical protein